MKTELCKAFCDGIQVRDVPAGLAVGTSFRGINGDPIGFYVVPVGDKYRIEDDGSLMPMLEVSGADLQAESRKAAFAALLKEHEAVFDEEQRELRSKPVSVDEVPAAALRFTSLLLRAQDLLWMTFEKAASTFKEEAAAKLKEAFANIAELIPNGIVAKELADFPADLLIRAKDKTRGPVALFYVLSDARMYEAALLAQSANYKTIPCSVVALMEDGDSVHKRTLNQTMNLLSPMTYYGHEADAINGIVREAVGVIPQPIH